MERLQEARHLLAGAITGLEGQLREIQWIEERRAVFETQAEHTPDDMNEMSYLTGTHGALLEHVPAGEERVRDLETLVHLLERLLEFENQLDGQRASGAVESEVTQSIANERQRDSDARDEARPPVRRLIVSLLDRAPVRLGRSPDTTSSSLPTRCHVPSASASFGRRSCSRRASSTACHLSSWPPSSPTRPTIPRGAFRCGLLPCVCSPTPGELGGQVTEPEIAPERPADPVSDQVPVTKDGDHVLNEREEFLENVWSKYSDEGFGFDNLPQ